MGLAFARRGNRVKLKPPPAPAGGIPAGSSPVRAAQKWVRMPGCQQALRQTLLWCQMGASLPAPAWGFPRAAGTHTALESHTPASCAGCKLAQVGVLGLPLTCAFTVGVGRSGSYIWKAFGGHIPHPVPIPGALSVYYEMLAL